jgi:hypothetical protein
VQTLGPAEEVITICFIFSLFSATAWAVAGYVLLYISSITDGGMRTAGRLLSIWVLTVASLIPLFGAYITLKGFCPIDSLIASIGAV